MRSALLCLLLVTLVLLDSVQCKKSFSTRRKSGGNSRRGQSNHQKPPPPAPATPHRTDSSTNFLNSERANSGGQGATNTHYRKNPLDNAPSAPQPPKQNVPQTNGPIGFEKLNTDVKQKSAASGVASAPAYPGAQSASYPGKPSAPNGPPPAYPGQGSAASGSHGGYEPPPAYPGRPVNAPPVYSANNPQNPQRNDFGGYHQQNGYQPGGVPHQQTGYQQGGTPYQQNSYQQGGAPYQQNGYHQGGVPHQQSPYPQQQWSSPGQQNFGYPNSGGGFGHPQQGYNQGFGSYPNGGGFGGYGNSHMGGQSYGGSPFGQSNPYGGSPFSSPGGFGGFGGNSFGGHGGYGNNHYSPNNFGYSNNPGIFGSMFGGNSNQYGYRKRSRFGGLPIPIPIPIPIPMGMFGGRSHNHRVLDTFVKNQTVTDSDNSTAVYVLNNSTVTPCTTDQFIYNSLNVTVLSCTAGNCTAIKVFVTANVSGEVLTHSAGITMCLEDNTTYSSFADNVNPTVSDLHKYWMKVCKENSSTNSTSIVQGPAENVSLNVTQTVLNETVISEVNKTTDQSVTPSTTQPPVESSTSKTLIDTTSSAQNSSSDLSNSTFCETFNCSSIEMCLPSIEIVDRCATSDCPFTRTGYRPCITVKMCKSPSTPISTFATLNTTLSRIDQYNNITSVNDVANLTLVSYMPPALSADCSQNATDPACQSQSVPQASTPLEVCAPGTPALAADGTAPNNGTACAPPQGVPQASVPLEVCAPGTPVMAADGTATNNGTACAPPQGVSQASVPLEVCAPGTPALAADGAAPNNGTACAPPQGVSQASVPLEVCAPGTPVLAADGTATNNGTACAPPQGVDAVSLPSEQVSSTTESSVVPTG